MALRDTVATVRRALPLRGEHLVLLTLAAVLTLTYIFILRENYFGDEGFHHSQIKLFLRGEWRMDPALTMLPGYHLAISAIAAPLGWSSLNQLRLISLAFGLLSILAFHWTVRSIDPRASWHRTVQFAFLPILLPVFPLLYTDVLSLLFVVLGVLAVVRSQHAFAALSGTLSVAIRQNNIIWLGFLFLLSLALVWRECVSLSRRQGRLSFALRPITRRRAVRLLTGLAAYGIGFALFGAFLAWNGSLAVGDRGSHPFPAVHLGNVVFALFLCGVLFLPLHLAQLSAAVRRLASSPRLSGILVAVFVAYIFLFVNDHHYNQGLDSVFLRNRILSYATLTPSAKALAFLPVALSLLSLTVLRLRDRLFVILYPCTLLFLLPSWLVEQRYYFAPFTLLLLFRSEQPRWVEWTLTLYTVAVAAVLEYVVVTRTLFL